MIESEVYKLSAGAYMRQLFPLYLKRRWWLFVLVALPFPVLALWNLNFLYAALMVEFFVIPMMLGLAYFYYALSDTPLPCKDWRWRNRTRVCRRGECRHFSKKDRMGVFLQVRCRGCRNQTVSCRQSHGVRFYPVKRIF